MEHRPRSWALGDPCRRSDYICRLIRRYFTWLAQFPYYAPDELAKRIRRVGQQPDAEEFSEYASCSSSRAGSRRRQYAVMSLCLAYSLKIVYPFWLAARTIDFRNVHLNSSNLWMVDENTVQAFCIRTNCTKFFLPDNEFTLDLSQTPLIPLCYPNLNRFYMPTTFLTPYAILLHFVCSSVTFFWGSLLPLISLNSPSGCDTLMFLVAPHLTRNFMYLSARKIYDDYKTSLVNYISKRTLASRAQASELRCPYRFVYRMHPPTGIRTTAAAECHQRLPVKVHGEWAPDACGARKSAPSGAGAQDPFVQDCLPSVRALRWHPKAQGVFVRKFAFVCCSMAAQCLVLAIDLVKRALVRTRDLDVMRAEVYRSGCRAWYLDGHEVLPPEILKVRWNPLVLSENLLLLLIVTFIVCILTLGFMLDYELSSWLSEVHARLEVLIEVTERLDEPTADRDSATHRSEDLIEAQYEPQVNPCTTHRPVADSWSRTTSITPDQYLERMLKLYISHRLLLDHVRHCSSSLPLLSLGTYLAAFIVEAITVWHGRLIGQFGSEHILLTAISSVWALALLAVMSNLHAKSRKTERTLWTLVAVISAKNPADIRLRHIKSLWLKQLIRISDEGGVALRLYGMRMTYVNVLQAILLLTSLITLAAY